MKVVTPVQDGFMYTEYVYWNLTGGKKLLGVNKVSMEPFTCEVTTSFFDFRVFNQDRWEEASIGKLSDLINEISPISENELRESGLVKSLFNGDFSPGSFKLSLPQKGKDIGISFTKMDDATADEVRKITLYFNDGTFEIRK